MPTEKVESNPADSKQIGQLGATMQVNDVLARASEAQGRQFGMKDYLAGLDMETPEGVAWHIVVTMIEFPDGVEVDGHGWYGSCAKRIADHIRAISD